MANQRKFELVDAQSQTLSDVKQQAIEPLEIPSGPITRARAKKIKEALIGLVQETWQKQMAIRPTNNAENVICLIWAESGAIQLDLGSKTSI